MGAVIEAERRAVGRAAAESQEEEGHSEEETTSRGQIEDWRTSQEGDSHLARISQWKREGHLPSRTDLAGEGYALKSLVAQLPRISLIEGVLWRTWWEPGGRERQQVVVPEDRIKEVLGEVHGSPLSSHLED